MCLINTSSTWHHQSLFIVLSVPPLEPAVDLPLSVLSHVLSRLILKSQPGEVYIRLSHDLMSLLLLSLLSHYQYAFGLFIEHERGRFPLFPGRQRHFQLYLLIATGYHWLVIRRIRLLRGRRRIVRVAGMVFRGVIFRRVWRLGVARTVGGVRVQERGIWRVRRVGRGVRWHERRHAWGWCEGEILTSGEQVVLVEEIEALMCAFLFVLFLDLLLLSLFGIDFDFVALFTVLIQHIGN